MPALPRKRSVRQLIYVGGAALVCSPAAAYRRAAETRFHGPKAMHEEWDAIVVGGGPAGGIAAMLLARLGWRCALVERCERHRTKTCGHCLSPAAMPLLRSIAALDEVRAIADAQLEALRVHLPNRRPMRLPLANEWDDRGLVVARSRLDQLLIDRAAACGAMVFQPATARLATLERRAATINVVHVHGREHLRMRTRLLVAADGLRSAIARAATGSHAHVGRKYGFSFNVAAGAAPIERGTIDMFAAPGGYLGVVHGRDDRLHIAALVSGRRRRDPSQFRRDLAAHHPALRGIGLDALDGQRMADFTAIGPMPCAPRRVASGPVALVGDAAGYVEPFTGEGMFWAMLGAAALAEVASCAAPGEWCEGSAADYRRLWIDRVGRRQRWCAAIAWALERPAMVATLARIVPGRDAMLRRIAARVSAA
jgi:menaquinone-9 beta-reductase